MVYGFGFRVKQIQQLIADVSSGQDSSHVMSIRVKKRAHHVTSIRVQTEAYISL
jgi:hypothetical protein